MLTASSRVARCRIRSLGIVSPTFAQAGAVIIAASSRSISIIGRIDQNRNMWQCWIACQRIAPNVYISISGYMESNHAIEALSALAQSTRLEAFKLLVRHEPVGLAAGDIAGALSVPQNTMSAHLATLTRAGLVTSARRGRSIIYRADLDGFRALTLFLLKDCCAGSPEVCAPLLEELSPCC